MKTIETTVYEFDELSPKAKQKAREWYCENLAYSGEWWDYIYEDAARIGLTLRHFDLDRNRHATGEFKYFGGAEQCASLILKEHGKDCATFKTATRFLSDLKKLNKQIADVDGDDETNCEYEVWQDKRGQLNDDFLRALLDDYSQLLQDESEYLASDEAVDENIKANQYTFLETGKRFG